MHDLPAVPHSTGSTLIKAVPVDQKVWQLGKWLETETAKFNAQFSERQLSTPLLEFLILATRQARQLHSKVFYELTKQVCRLQYDQLVILHACYSVASHILFLE